MTQLTVGAQPVKRLSKGELLFAEGEKSRAMYLIKSGSIRLFMKKGDSNIEIDTVRAGQILGELAFLDGNPRSVSGEALTDCELVEISGPMFMEVLGKAPEWLKIMLKTVVGRLRAANTRLRQLETANVAVDYGGKDGGKRLTSFQYLSLVEVMKICTALLLVGTRNAKKVEEGMDIDLGLVNRYVNSIMGVPVAKISGVLDILDQTGFAIVREENGNPRVFLKSVGFLEVLIEFLAEQNQLDPMKRTQVSVRGFLIMSMTVNQLSRYKKDERTGLTIVNLAEVRNAESTTEKDPFRNEDASELVQLGYISDLKIKSNYDVFASINTENFLKAFHIHKFMNALKELNEQKKSISK